MKLLIFWTAFLIPASIASAFQAAHNADACRRIEGDHIRAADLAAAMPAFATLDPALELGLSPLPGVTRVFHPADLLRLAKAYGVRVSGPLKDVCFENHGPPVRSATAPTAPAPLAVRRGELVAVRAVCGGVALRFEAEAASSGRPGDTVILLNPENGGRFAARIEGQGKAIVNR